MGPYRGSSSGMSSGVTSGLIAVSGWWGSRTALEESGRLFFLIQALLAEKDTGHDTIYSSAGSFISPIEISEDEDLSRKDSSLSQSFPPYFMNGCDLHNLLPFSSVTKSPIIFELTLFLLKLPLFPWRASCYQV